MATIIVPKLPHFRQFVKGVKIFHFLVKSVLGDFYRPLVTFNWSRYITKEIGRQVEMFKEAFLVAINVVFK